MEAREAGWYELTTDRARVGDLYRYRIDGVGEFPDPASRYNPQGVHGPSQLLDPGQFVWNDRNWRGRPWEEAVLYELHVGTFTPQGTFAAVRERLDYLRELGVTAIQLLPVAAFAGAHNWGYDGVLPFAPAASYGHPDELKDLIQTAHHKGMMVLLDLACHYFGPEGNYLHLYAPAFFAGATGLAGRSIDGQPGGARVHHPQCAVLAGRVPSRRPAPECGAAAGAGGAVGTVGGAGSRRPRGPGKRPSLPPAARS
jgi:malto-oligosyltrehalose trehalohydrolase